MDAHIDRVTYVAGDEVTEFAVIPLNLRMVHFWYSIFEFRSVAGQIRSLGVDTKRSARDTEKHQHLANFVYNMIMYTGLFERTTNYRTAENR